MLAYSYIHNSEFDQLLRWWKRIDEIPSDFEGTGMDEVAYGLSLHQPQGISLLKMALMSSDLEQFQAALSFLARPEFDNEEVRSALNKGFESGDYTTITIVMHGYVAIQYFPLLDKSLELLITGSNERLAARAMVYKSHARPTEAVAILADALISENPRMREYACDQIGDRGIIELKEAMSELLIDPHPDVSSAAAVNMLFFE